MTKSRLRRKNVSTWTNNTTKKIVTEKAIQTTSIPMKRAAIPVKIKESSIKTREGGMIQKSKEKNKLSLMRKNSTGDT